MIYPKNQPDTQRLNKFLALSLGVSRRQADDLIEQGKITINDTTATLGARFIEGDIIKCSGQVVSSRDIKLIALHKPVGYICSRRRQGDTPTIYELLPTNLHNLKPVGRLDKDSSGLILLTNDGDFAFRMTHPSFVKQKRYHVALDSPLQPLHQQMISDFGVMLEDGGSRFMIERVTRHEATDELQGEGVDVSNSLRDSTGGASPSYIITMTEGRNRQIRRTFSALGYTVTKLHRTNFGNYSLGDIKPGEYKTQDIS